MPWSVGPPRPAALSVLPTLAMAGARRSSRSLGSLHRALLVVGRGGAGLRASARLASAIRTALYHHYGLCTVPVRRWLPRRPHAPRATSSCSLLEPTYLTARRLGVTRISASS